MEIQTRLLVTTSKCTVSQLNVNGLPFCFVLEDAIRETKVKGRTAIPEGRYQVKKRTQGTTASKHRTRYGHSFVPHIVNVPNFEFILIHPGNTIVDTEGCPLVGLTITIVDRETYVLKDSRPAFMRLFKEIETAFSRGEEVWYEVIR